MKRFLFLFFAVALAAASCTRLHPHATHNVPETALVAIDSLLWSQPDSAFARLQDFDTNHAIDSLDAFNRHYFHLLLSELLYKNDYAQSNRNELLQAVDYYDSLVAVLGSKVRDDLAFLDARVHYIDGVGYYEMDSVVPACEQYLKAVELMEERFSEKELVGKKAQFMAMAYTRLTKLYSDQYLHEQAIAFGKQSLPYYHKYCAEPWHEAWILDAIGMHYHMMDEMDSAYHFYQDAYHHLPDTIGLMYRDIKMHMLQLFHVEGLSTPQEVIAQMHSLLDDAESEREYCARCLTIGDFFYIERQFDSAWPYLNKVFYGTASIGSKKQAAEWLVQICKELGKNDEAVAYADFLVPFANQEENKSTVKTRLTELYSAHVQNGQAFLRQQWIKRRILWLSLIAIPLSLLLSLALVVYHGKRRQRLNDERNNNETSLKALGGRLRSSNEALRSKIEENLMPLCQQAYLELIKELVLEEQRELRGVFIMQNNTI